MFFQKKMKNGSGGLHEINMTPLIDVSLVLVVMLLLATPLAFESSISVRKARKSAKVGQEKKVEDRIELKVVSEDSIQVNRKPVARNKLAVTLRPLMEASSSRLVFIECDGGVSHGTFVDVLDQAKLSGASDIAVSGK
jgi:biopolymer transport protein ExbD